MNLLNKLYRDLDLEYSDNFKEWIFNYILVGILNNLYYGIVWLNFLKMLYFWRKRLSFKDVKIIEDECGDVIDLLGFRKVIDVED